MAVVCALTMNVTVLADPPVFYIPRRDVAMALVQRSETKSYCPYKGDASHFSISLGEPRSADAIWSYEAP